MSLEATPSDGAEPAARPRRGGLRAAQREFTRARFIESAITEFGARGYARTTVDDIVTRAGATRATFYLHFKSKADILLELNERVLAAFAGVYDDLATIAENPTTEHIREWLSQSVRCWAGVRDYVAPLWEGAALDPEIRELVERGDNQRLELLADALAAGPGGATMRAPEITAAILLTPLRHFFGQYIRGTPVETERVLDALSVAWTAVINAASTPEGRPKKT